MSGRGRVLPAGLRREGSLPVQVAEVVQKVVEKTQKVVEKLSERPPVKPATKEEKERLMDFELKIRDKGLTYFWAMAYGFLTLAAGLSGTYHLLWQLERFGTYTRAHKLWLGIGRFGGRIVTVNAWHPDQWPTWPKPGLNSNGGNSQRNPNQPEVQLWKLWRTSNLAADIGPRAGMESSGRYRRLNEAQD